MQLPCAIEEDTLPWIMYLYPYHFGIQYGLKSMGRNPHKHFSGCVILFTKSDSIVGLLYI